MTIGDLPLGLPPTESAQAVLLEHRYLFGDNVGVQLRALLVPPATATWRFWVSGSDAAELWLSTDASHSNAQRIAWTTAPTAFRGFDQNASQTTTRALVKGQKYYLEVLQKGGTNGSNHVSVTWCNATGSGVGGLLNQRQVINALHLEPYAPTNITAPSLTATCSLGNLLLTWPADASGYWLQAATNLTSPGLWSAVPTSPFLTNGWGAVVLPMTDRMQFYRLSYQP